MIKELKELLLFFLGALTAGLVLALLVLPGVIVVCLCGLFLKYLLLL